jgi:spectinomycin phosphotransferase
VPPAGIDERQLSGVLAEHWGLAAGRLGYLPVGFGDHHWELTDSAGRHWFVTVAGLAGGWRGTGPDEGHADLRAAMDTLTALAGAGLECAVAPVPATDGRALARLGTEHTLSGRTSSTGRPLGCWPIRGSRRWMTRPGSSCPARAMSKRNSRRLPLCMTVR